MSLLFVSLLCKLIYDGIATMISHKIAESQNPYREYYQHFAEKTKEKQEVKQDESVG